MGDLDQLVDTYERVINGADEDTRQAAASQALADGFTFVGPQVGEVTGREAVVETMRAMREQAPADVQIRRTTPIDEHNGWLRFGWEFADEDGRTIARGLDVAQLADDGRLAAVVAFFDESPQPGD